MLVDTGDSIDYLSSKREFKARLCHFKWRRIAKAIQFNLIQILTLFFILILYLFFIIFLFVSVFIFFIKKKIFKTPSFIKEKVIECNYYALIIIKPISFIVCLYYIVIYLSENKRVLYPVPSFKKKNKINKIPDKKVFIIKSSL
jgi:hypothetical protein